MKRHKLKADNNICDNIKVKAVSKTDIPISKLKSYSGIKLMQYWGTRSYEIKEDKFEKAITIIFQKFHQKFPEFETVRNKIIAQMPKTYNDLIELYSTSEPKYNFINLLIAKQAIETKPNILEIEGDINLGEILNGVLLFHGDIHIKGSLLYNAQLYITGNLIVDRIIKSHGDWNPLLVGGNIISEAIDHESPIYCAGNIKSFLVTVAGSRVFFVGLKLITKLLLMQDYDEIDGFIKAKRRVNYFVNDPKTTLRKFSTFLTPEIIKKIECDFDKEDGMYYFKKDSLFDLIKNGINIWK